MTPQSGTRAILLAAGEGRRFGANKLHHAQIDGQALGLVTAEIYSAIMPTVVVVRAGDRETADMFEEAGFKIITAESASEGMGHSIAAGAKFLQTTDSPNCLIGLADMPFIAAPTLLLLRDCLNAGKRLVRPRYMGQAGNPVGFQREFFSALTQFQGDRGARDLLKENAEHVHLVDVDDSGVIEDIDRPADLARHPSNS